MDGLAAWRHGTAACRASPAACQEAEGADACEAANALQAQSAHLAPGVALQVGGMAQQPVQGAALAAGPLGDAQVAQVRLHDGRAHVQGLRRPLH